jgi:flagellar L-ring protein FlgH
MRILTLSMVMLTACGRMSQVGRAPDFTPLEGSYEHHAMYSTPLPETTPQNGPTDASSLWTAGSSSLFGDRRAANTGDILTVVIEINDSAEM